MKNLVWPALVCAFIACTNSKTTISEKESGKLVNGIEQASWLLGAWFNESRKGVNYEEWKKYNDTTYVGKSYSIQGGDTTSSEHIKLVQNGSEINYIPTVEDQNMGMPITFKLTFINDNKLVFENPAHDFPQTITYKRLSGDSLVAEISGVIKGKYRAREFPMRRVK